MILEQQTKVTNFLQPHVLYFYWIFYWEGLCCTVSYLRLAFAHICAHWCGNLCRTGTLRRKSMIAYEGFSNICNVSSVREIKLLRNPPVHHAYKQSTDYSGSQIRYVYPKQYPVSCGPLAHTNHHFSTSDSLFPPQREGSLSLIVAVYWKGLFSLGVQVAFMVFTWHNAVLHGNAQTISE